MPKDFNAPLALKPRGNIQMFANVLWQPDAPLTIHLPLHQGKEPLLDARLRLVVNRWQMYCNTKLVYAFLLSRAHYIRMLPYENSLLFKPFFLSWCTQESVCIVQKEHIHYQ